MTILTEVLSAFSQKLVTDRPAMTPGGYGFINTGTAQSPGGMLPQMQSMGSVGWLFSVVEKITNQVASVEWELFRVTPNGDRTKVERHPALDLWNSPNPFYTNDHFIEAGQQHQELVGETYWCVLKNLGGRPIELWPMRPDRIKPIPSAEQFIAGYEYRLGSTVIPLDADDVIPMLKPSPMDPYRGMGVVQSILSDLDAEKLAARWTRNFFFNDATPGGIIELQEDLGDEQWERFIRRWDEQHRGVNNSHRVAILEKAVWKDRKFTLRDMQFEQMRHLSRDIILGAFGVTGWVVGMMENANRASAEAAMFHMAQLVTIPRLRKIKAALNTRLLPMFGVTDLEFDFVDPTPENRELNLEEADRGYKAGILTRNESRLRIGEGEVPGGDEFIAQGQPPVPFQLSQGGSTIYLRGSNDPERIRPDEVDDSEIPMEDAWQRRLSLELTLVEKYLSDHYPDTKAVNPMMDDFDWDWYARHGAEVERELEAAFIKAAQTFAPSVSPGVLQTLASEYALTEGAALLRVDGPMNLAQLTRERVNTIISEGLQEGRPLGSVSKTLREDFAFSRKRATLIARTETTRALGDGHRNLAKNQGDTEKRWMTQMDNLVRDTHRENQSQGWIPIDDAFGGTGTMTINEPNCRCNVIYRTGLENPVQERSIIAEMRCPGCNKLVGKDVSPGASHKCPRCKMKFKA